MLALGVDIGGTRTKLVLLRDGEAMAQAVTAPYVLPSASDLSAAIAAAAEGWALATSGVQAVGLCLPGLVDHAADGPRLRLSVNLPALVGVPLAALLQHALSTPPGLALHTFSDARAAATDFVAQRGDALPGRTLALSLGTGVGAAVLDDGVFLGITSDGASSGHIGQIDVSVSPDPARVPVGRDGGAGSLEAYIGVPALRAWYGPDLQATLPRLTVDEPPLTALARAIRICHAIYRPHHIALLGGVGLGLRHLGPALHQVISDRLTSLARPGWSLLFADDELHAARGTARLAARAARAAK
jgi:predicted NBD/HSP70 family sugar kinase